MTWPIPNSAPASSKITPAHDLNDFEAGKRHNLPMIQVIDDDAKITAAGGAYAGLDRYEARKRVVDDLEKLGLLDSVQDYTLSLGKCSRCKTVGRAAGFEAVVRKDEAAGRKSHRGRR